MSKQITINMNKKTVWQILGEVAAVKNVNDRAAILREVCKQRNCFAKLIQYTYHANVKFDLPDGDLPNVMKDNDVPMDTGGLQYQLNRANWHVLWTGSIAPKHKKESMFQNIYLSVHEQDREVLVGMKDKKLPFRNLNEKFCRKALPELFKNEQPNAAV